MVKRGLHGTESQEEEWGLHRPSERANNTVTIMLDEAVEEGVTKQIQSLKDFRQYCH